MQDIERQDLYRYLKAFEGDMRNIRKQLAETEKLYYQYHKERVFLDIVIFYGQAMESLAKNLPHLPIKSRGFITFCNYLTSYTESLQFKNLLAEARAIIHELSSIKYSVHIKELRVRVLDFQPGDDYTEEVQATFAKFKQGDVKDYRSGLSYPLGMNHVEAKILDGVAYLNPDAFARLDAFYKGNTRFQDETIVRFDREVQFYLAYFEYIENIKKAGLEFCYPQVSAVDKEIDVTACFDLPLAHKLVSEKKAVVANDFYLKGHERILVVTGPNQGGKTTFARTFGQLHYLAGLGLPVPGSRAKLFLCNNIFTHFEKEENVLNLRSKLEDDLARLHWILGHCTPDTIVIMNEILTSTTLQDGIFLSKKIMEDLTRLDVLCVWVTFIDELASFNEKTVSMVGAVVSGDPSQRTFKFSRMPANGLAYAISVAEKYQLTYSELKKRIIP